MELIGDHNEHLMLKFNLPTYFNMVQVETSERFVGEMESLYNQPTEHMKPLSDVTVATCARLLDPSKVYLEEIGDKLIKLAIHIVVRHLNFVLDKVTEKKTMATERLLYILEDLFKL